jgi:signal transduction histidine kinase/CRP-like cAMP-binding protein
MPQLRFPTDLKNNKFFSELGDSILSNIYDPKELKEKREGEIIYRTGEDSTAVYLLINGEVRVKYSSNNYVSSKSSSGFFGEKELIDNTRRISSAVAFTRVTYYRLDRSIFKKLILKNSTIYDNVLTYGEINLPEINKDIERKFSVLEKTKPVSFNASPDIGSSRGKDKKEEESSVKTNQFLDQQEQEPEQNNVENYLTPDDLSQQLEEELLEDSSELNSDKLDSVTTVEDNQKPELEKLPEDKTISSSKKDELENTKVKENEKAIEENGINRETVRKIFASIEVIYSSVTITELIEKTVKALKDLTASESGNLILVDEKLSTMKKIFAEDKQYKEELFQLPDGLTGTCALQKKILNFERPTEDSRYLAKIDQPGTARLKRILYFPVINEVGETLAVIQLACENKKYSELDISHLNMLSKQIVSAIERAFRLEDYLNEERKKSNKKLKDLLLYEIRDPINIINSYTDILSEKKLAEEIDEVIRMLQKQANSIEDLTDTLLSSVFAEYKLDLRSLHFNEFIEDVLELLSEYCQARDVTLFKKIGGSALVDVDRSKFYSALLQIIRYSCEDVKKNGKIYLSTELRDDSIIITLQGEGKGSLQSLEGEFKDVLIGKNNNDKIYTGMLLAKEIISSHRGQFEFNSIKGKETSFTITLPISNSSLN